MKRIIFILFIFFTAFATKAQEVERTNILFVLDASFSMRKEWETKSKWEIAKETLVDVADSLKSRLGDNVYFGIRTDGHQSLPIKNDCEDSELILPIANNSIQTLRNVLAGISPKGITPLAYSLEKTRRDFKGYKGKNILILITDGAESCEGDPCKIMKILMDYKVILKPFIIGLNIPIEALQSYKCIGGVVYNERSQADFKKNLHRSIDKSLNYTSLQVNLLDANNENTQTDKVMFFYRKSDHKLMYTFYHKMENGISDTIYVEPISYKIEVQTIPKVVSRYFSLNAAEHNVVNIKCPTGSLQFVNTDINNQKITIPKPLKYLIKKQGVKNYLHQEYIGKKQEYLIGKYDIDILTLPPIQTSIEIKDRKNIVLKIPAAGRLSIKSQLPIHGAIFVEKGKNIENIYSLKTNTTQDLIALQPGKYELVFRYSKERKMMKTKTIHFEIKALKTFKIEL